MPHVRLYQGDTLKILPTLLNEQVDLVLTDPPFAIYDDMAGRRKSNPEKYKRNYEDTWDYFKTDTDFEIFTMRWLDYIKVMLKPGGYIATYFDKYKINLVIDHLLRYDFKPVGIIADIVQNPVPPPPSVIINDTWAPIIVMRKAGGTINRKKPIKDYILRYILNGEERTEHPTQKPVSVFYNLISTLTKEGDTVLDPFLGSGTTMVASIKANRNCIGIERNEKYIDVIKQRVQWGRGIDVSYEFVDLSHL